MEKFNAFKQPVGALNLSTSAKRQLIEDIANELGIGGWAYKANFDVSDKDIEDEWAQFVATASENDIELTAYHVALMLATQWERECLLGA